MPNDKLQRLYENVSKEYDLPDYETFQADMADEGKRKKMYEAISSDYELPDYETFSLDMGFSKGEQPVGGATSGQGSNAPMTPFKGSGTERGAKIKELTARAVTGDETAKQELIALKAATQAKPQAKQEFPIQTDASLQAVEGKEVGKETPKTPFVAPKTQSPILSKEKVVEKAEKGIYEENKADVDLYKQEATSPSVDVASMVQSTLSDDANIRIKSESDLEQYYKGLEFDYKKYLAKKGDNEAIEKYDQLSSLPAEDRDETDELFLRSFREQAVEKSNVANMVRFTELKNSVNLQGYDKETAKLSAEFQNIKNDNSEAAIARKQQIVAQMHNVIQQTGITEEVAAELNHLKRNITAGEALAYKSGAGFTKIAAQEQEQKKELEDRAEAISSSNPLVFAPALAKEMINAYSGAVGKGVLSTLQVPKVLGDFLGDNDYGVVDRLYDWSEGVMQERKGTFDKVQNFDKLPDFVQLPIMFSEGIGSVVQFAAGGELAQAAKIPVMVGTFGTSFLTTEAMYYKEALDSGMSRQDAAKSATFIAATTSLIESMIPDLKYFEPSAYRKSIIDLMKKGLSSEQAAKELMPTIVESLGEYTKVGLKEGGEEFAGALGENGAKALVNSITGETNYVGLQNPENYTTAIVMGFVTGAGANVMARPQAQRTKTQERVLYEAALNKDEVLSAIEEQAPQNAEMANAIEIAEKTLNGLESLPNFSSLDEGVKAHVASEATRKKQLEQAVKETGVDESVIAPEIETINKNVEYALENNAVRGEEKVKGEAETPAPTMEWSGEEVKAQETTEDVAVEESPINQSQEAEAAPNVAEVGQNDGVTTEQIPVEAAIPQEDSVSVEPIKQLGTGANVYFETDKHRVNDDLKSGKVLLNIGSKESEFPMANIKFDDAAEAVAVAKELDRIYPNGVPSAVLIDKVVENIRQEITNKQIENEKVNTEREASVPSPVPSGKGKEQQTRKEKVVPKVPKLKRAASVETADVNDFVMQQFINGAKVTEQAARELFKSTKNDSEIKSRKQGKYGLISEKGAKTIDTLVHSIWENQADVFGDKIFDTSEIRDAVENALLSHTHVGQMADSIIERYETNVEKQEQEYYDQLRHEASKNGYTQDELDEAYEAFASMSEKEIDDLHKQKELAFYEEHLDKDQIAVDNKEAEIKSLQDEYSKKEAELAKLKKALEKNLSENQLNLLGENKTQSLFNDAAEQQALYDSKKKALTKLKETIAKEKENLQSLKDKVGQYNMFEQPTAVEQQAPTNEIFSAIDAEIAQTDKREVAATRKANKEKFGETYKKATRITKNFNQIVERLEKEGKLTKECP